MLRNKSRAAFVATEVHKMRSYVPLELYELNKRLLTVHANPALDSVLLVRQNTKPRVEPNGLIVLSRQMTHQRIDIPYILLTYITFQISYVHFY